MNLLSIGPRYGKKPNSKKGGVVVLFENWIEYCEEQGIINTIVDLTRQNRGNTFSAYLTIIRDIFKQAKRNDVLFFNGTFGHYLFIAPFAIWVGKLYHKKVILRKFAGNFDKIYNQSGLVKRKILDYVLKNADLTFWETKKLVDFAHDKTKKALWFPNVRKPISGICRDSKRPFEKRFVFISQVKKEKGVDLIIEAFTRNPDLGTVDIYGDLINYTPKDLKGMYKGVLNPKDVLKKLSEYDCLLLPTSWSGEGYPGIIIEALSVGIPSISTDIGGITEIIEDGKNGLIMKSTTADGLVEAIKQITSSNYGELSRGAKDSFDNFNSDIINKSVVNLINS